MLTAHSLLSASGSKRWMSCSGSVRLESHYPTEQSSPFAAQGTGAHALGEYCLINNILDVDTQFGKIFEGIKVDAEMVEAIQQYVDYVNAEAEGSDLYLVEQRVSLSEIRDDMFGTADTIVIRNGICNVIDLKYGAGIRVSAFENSQGLYYAAGVSMAYGKRYGIHTYKVTIVQPRMDNISEFSITAGKLNQWVENELRPAVLATENPSAPLNPTAEGCRWCKAKPDCRAFSVFSMNQAVEGFQFIEKPKIKEPDFITPKQLSILYGNLPLMKMFIKTIEDKVLLDLQNGKSVEGYTLVEGRSTRQWKDPAAVEKLLRKKHRVAKIFTPRKLITPTAAEKMLGTDKHILENHIHKPLGKLVVGYDQSENDKQTTTDSRLDGFDFKK